MMAKYNILSDNDDFADTTKIPLKDIAQKSVEENLQMEVKNFSQSCGKQETNAR
jgi:hypothetical protein